MQLGILFLVVLICAIVFIFIEMLRIVFTSDDPAATYSYEGSKDKNGKPHGEGTLHLPNGDCYEGSFKHGHFHGQGQYHFTKGSGGGRYIGKFREGRYDGKGHELYGDGSHYRGMFRKGLRHGYGKMVFTDGSSCEGTWRLGKKHGQCVLVYEKEKTVVEVGFVKGKRQGSCMTRHGDHDVVYSEWRDGLKIRDCITVQQHQAKEREARRKKRLERKRGQHLAVSGVDRYTSAKHTMSETSSVESAKLEQMKSKKDRKNEERRREKMNLSRLQYRSSVASALSSSSLSSNGTDVNHHNNSAGAGAGASAGSDCANGTGNGQGSGNGMVRKRRGGAKVRAGVNHDRNKYTKHTRNKHSKLDAQMSNGESSGVDSDDDDEEDEEESLTMLDY